MTRISKANKLADDGEVDNKTLSQASQALKRWANIDVYTPSGEFREFDVIMTELAEKWNDLSDAEQANISFAIAATRQTAVLRSVLEQWTSAMNLATDAVNANGNALANQQKYIDSIQGKTQALKTEVSALWINLFNSDSIKELIDSLKEMVISLQDTTTGLKPIVDILATLFKWISKLLSIVPAGGLIASILGWKIGAKGLSIPNLMKLLAWTKAYVNVLGPLKGALAGVGVGFQALWGILENNPIGLALIGLTTAVTLFSKIHKSANELKQDAAEARKEAEEIQNKIDSLNQSLKEQQQIIDSLQGKRLTYIDEQQLKNAREMTAELKTQVAIEEERLRAQNGNVVEKTLKEWRKSDYYKLNLESSYDDISGLDDDSIKKRQDLVTLLGELEDNLNSNQAAYDLLVKARERGEALTTDEKDFMSRFVAYSQMRDKAQRKLYPTLWDETQFEKINNTDNPEAQKQLKQLTDKWKNKNYTYDFIPVSMIVEEIESEGYDALREVINNVTFSGDILQEHNAETWAKQFWGMLKPNIESEIANNPIDLATWYTDKSSVDNEKTWKDILDSYESGLNNLGDLLDKWKSGKEVIDMKDIFDVTDVTDSIFSQFGTPAFKKYVEQAGGDIGAALANYIQSSYTNLLNNVDNPELIKDFDIVTEKLQKVVNVARGGANDIDVLAASYKELTELYNAVSQGETLEVDEAARLIDTYGALQDAVQIVGDKYSFEKDAIINLINEYIELQNTSVSAQITATKQTITETTNRLKAYGIEIEMLKSLGISKILASEAYGAQDKQALAQIIGQYIDAEGKLKELEDIWASIIGDRDKYKSDSSNEIDWIANSLENLARKTELAQTAYDHLLSVTGSSKALKTANDKLQAVNNTLEEQAAGFDKAAVSYKREYDALGLTAEQMKRVQNVALGNEPAWTIQEFKGDSTDYDKLNKALDLYKKWQDQIKSAIDTRHQITENDIQMLQNVSDYYSNQIAKYEAMITPETSVKKQQKYVTKLIELYQKQYEEEKAIAELKGDEIALLKLQAEWEQKNNELIAQRRQISIDDITTRYDRILSEYNNRQSILEHGIAMTEAKGSLVSTKYYEALIDNERDGIDKLFDERKKLLSELKQIDTSSEEGLTQWWETKDAIDAVTNSLYESEEAMREWANAIRQVKWDLFDRITDTISGVSDETEHLINLLSRDDAFKYVKELWSNDGSQTKVYYGEWSKEGLATLGLYEMQLKTNKELAEDYAAEVKSLNKEIQEHPTDLNLIDRRNELLEKQREAIQAAEEEKQAILDLIRDGYDKQLDSLQTLIDKYMEALNSEKDLYDYQKNIKKQTKDIVNLRRQLAAFANDTSEEARGKIQRLTVELNEAEENLQDTQYDRYLSDQQNLLDRMYNTFETYVDNKMDERDKLLKEIEAKVEANQKAIKKTITDKTTEVGSLLTQTMKNVLKEPLNNGRRIEDVISEKETPLKAIEASTTSTDTLLKEYFENYNKEGGLRTTINAISTKIDSIDTNLIEIAKKLGANVDKTDNGNGTNTASSGEKTYAGGSKVKPLSDKKLTPDEENDGMFWGVNEDDFVNGTRNVSAAYAAAVYNKMYNDGGYLYEQEKYGPFEDDPRIYKIMYNWLHKRRKQLASGSRRIHNNELAWTQEKGLEAIIRPSDGAILTPLSRGDSVLNAGATQNIWDMANNPMQFIKDNLSFPINLPSNLTGGNYDIQQNMSITLPNVQNYSEFVTALQNDKRFERMLQDMTVNQLTNKNALAKFKYKY